MAFRHKLACFALLCCGLAPSAAHAAPYPPIVVGYFDAYYKSTPEPAASDPEVEAGQWNWHEASDAIAAGLKPELNANPWLHLFYGVDRYTIHNRTALENSFNENIEKTGDFDFVLKSIVSGSDGSYSLHVMLVEGTTREVLGDCTEAFANRADATAAGERAAKDLTSISGLIIKYWREHRKKSPHSAISPGLSITSTPSTSPNTSIPIDLRAVDCDGAPLSGAQVTLYCTCGKLNSVSVVLDGAGKASVHYHSGMLAALGSVTAQLDYTRPNGLHERLMASKAIRIGQRSEVWWEVHVHFKQVDTGTRDDTAVVDGGIARETAFDLATRQGDVTIWYRKQPSFASMPGSTRTGSPVAVVGAGSYIRHLHQAALKTSDSGMSGSIDLIDETGSLNITRAAGISALIRGGRITIAGLGLPFDTWTETFNQGFDSWHADIASAVDTHGPNDKIFFDLKATQTVSPGAIRKGFAEVHSHQVDHRTVAGVAHVIVTDVDGEVSTYPSAR